MVIALQLITKVLVYYWKTFIPKRICTQECQKSSDLRRIVSTALERDRKKYNIQLKQMKDTEKKDKYKVYGEILTAYGYSIEPGTKNLKPKISTQESLLQFH